MPALPPSGTSRLDAHRDYTGLTLRQICERHVLPMGVEVEQLQVSACAWRVSW